MIRHNDEYLWCFATATVPWRFIGVPTARPGPARHGRPSKGPASRQLWAPNHSIDGRWYICAARHLTATTPTTGIVRAGQRHDPFGAYELRAARSTGDDPDLRSDNRWAIDFTVLNHDGAAYGVWSSWAGTDDDVQWLYIAPMTDPTTVAAARTRLADNDDFDWERLDGPGNKGSQRVHRSSNTTGG